MTNEMQLPLSRKAVLVRCKLSLLNVYVGDAKVTHEVDQQNGVHGAGRYSKRLFKGCKPVEDALSAYREVYAYVRKATVPWDTGYGLLPSAKLLEFGAKFGSLKATAQSLRDALVPQWDALVAADIARLGPLGSESDYPASPVGRFDVSYLMTPVPEEGDFRVTMTDLDRAAFREALKDAEDTVVTNLRESLLEPLKKAVQTLGVPDGEKGGKFHDTLITNIVEAAQRALDLNLTGDPQVETLAKEALAVAAPFADAVDVVRRVPSVRQSVRGKLSNICAM
jgi:hypothetical protein